jgi:hypothetical protein
MGYVGLRNGPRWSNLMEIIQWQLLLEYHSIIWY